MVVYADILIVVNTIIDYFLIKATCLLKKRKISATRHIFASLLGGISSIYIFLQNTTPIIDFIFQCAVSFLFIIICFGIKNRKLFISAFLIMQAVVCGYTGFVIAVFTLFKPKHIVINNSIIYYQISPLMIILFTAIFYAVFTLLYFIFSKNSIHSDRCNIEVWANNSKIQLKAIVDTGNSIEDAMSNSEIIITNVKSIERLFGDYRNNDIFKNRIRKIPCGTVSGVGLLDGVRCDYALVNCAEKHIRLEKPILAISKSNFKDDYDAIVNPRIFT